MLIVLDTQICYLDESIRDKYQTSVTDRLAGPDRGTGTGLDWTDFSAVRSQSKRPDRETVSIFDPDRTKTFIAQAFINKLG